MSSKAKRIAERIFLRWLPLGVLLAFVMIPLLWVLSLSFKYSSDVVSETFTVLPNPFTLSNYSGAWSSGRHFPVLLQQPRHEPVRSRSGFGSGAV